MCNVFHVPFNGPFERPVSQEWPAQVFPLRAEGWTLGCPSVILRGSVDRNQSRAYVYSSRWIHLEILGNLNTHPDLLACETTFGDRKRNNHRIGVFQFHYVAKSLEPFFEFVSTHDEINGQR